MLEHQRERVAAAARALAAAGLVAGTAGNISERAGELIAVSASGAVLAEAGAEQVVVVDLDGNLVEGDLKPSSELALHLGAYRERGAGAVVHAHPPVATALACVIDELPAVHYEMVRLGGSVRVGRYATFGTDELARNTLAAMEGREAALMANHGALVVGADLDAALDRMRLLEWVAALYWRASALGSPRALGEAELEDTRSELRRRGYGALRPGPVASAAQAREETR
jgi:L-fuculose-phosphate aldolase